MYVDELGKFASVLGSSACDEFRSQMRLLSYIYVFNSEACSSLRVNVIMLARWRLHINIHQLNEVNVLMFENY